MTYFAWICVAVSSLVLNVALSIYLAHRSVRHRACKRTLGRVRRERNRWKDETLRLTALEHDVGGKGGMVSIVPLNGVGRMPAGPLL